MRRGRPKTFSLRGPVTLFTIIIVLIVTLTVLWNLALVQDYQTIREPTQSSDAVHWVLLAVGSTLFLAIIVLSSVLGAQLIARTRWNQRQSNLLASVTHELNSPLSSIKLFAQTVRRDDIEAADRIRFVDKILADVERLTRIVSNILRAAEADNRGDELHIVTRRIQLHAYLADYVSDARQIHEKDVELTLEVPADVEAEIDAGMFRQVLENLIDNAIRYRRQKPAHVTLRVLPREDAVELRVEDDGVGIPPDQVGDVFRRFYRVERQGVPPRRAGMGIGLFVVRSIVAAHGGEVGAESEGARRGTTVWIRLPVVKTDGDEV